MSKFLRFVSVSLVAFALVGCGKSSEEKAHDEAKSLVAEHAQVKAEIEASGAPNSKWSEAALNNLDAKLNRLEAIENELRARSGKDGVVITGGDNSYAITRLRSAIIVARAEKAIEALKTGTGSLGTGPGSIGSGTTDNGASWNAVLVARQNSLIAQITLAGEPTSAWSDEKLNDLQSKLRSLELIEDEIRVVNSRNRAIVGGNNSALIARLRAQIQRARAEKN